MVLETNTKQLNVNVNPAYPIYLGTNLAKQIAQTVKADYVALITDANINPLHGEALSLALKEAGKRGHTYEVPSGEASKSLSTLEVILQNMAQDGFDRKSAIIALGGGIVGDLAGFTAASYMRGIDFYQIPTSLLAMVDASVGGKTGVNLAEGKNLVGAFWQPKAVFIDIEYFQTLPETEFRHGAVELYKHGLLKDESILEDVMSSDFNLKGDTDFLIDLIARSVQVKADIVAEDERESGKRAWLNLGHTVAHALEASSKNALAHGDAVAYGLVFNAYLAKNRGYADETNRIQEFFKWVSPKPLDNTSFEELEPFLKRDKKNSGGRVKYVLLEEIGSPVVLDDLSPDELLAAWKSMLLVMTTMLTETTES